MSPCVLTRVEDSRRNGSGSCAPAAPPAGRQGRVTDLHGDCGRLDTENLSGNDCHERLRASSNVLRAATNLHSAVGINLHLRLASVATTTPRRGAAPHTVFHRPRRGTRGAVLGFPTKTLAGDTELFSSNLGWIVLNPQLERIHIQSESHLINDRFHAERGLRMSRCPHRSC